MKNHYMIWLSIFIILSKYTFSLCGEFIHYFPGYNCSKQTKIGSGSNGSAYLISRDGVKYIMKIQSLSQKSKTEVEVLRNLSGKPYIVQLIDSKIADKNHITIIEYGQLGDLEKFSMDHPDKFLDKEFTMQFFFKVLKGIKEIHDAGYVHTDLKPQNIVVDQNLDPIIIDFDLTVIQNIGASCRGTRGYMAPEVVKKFQTGHQCVFDGSEDIFSFGAVFYWATTGQRAFILPKMDYYYMIKLKIVFLADTDLEFYKISSSCLRQPFKRISMEELFSMFENQSQTQDEKLKQKIEYSLEEEILPAGFGKKRNLPDRKPHDLEFWDILLPIIVIAVTFGLAIGIVFFVHVMSKKKEESQNENDSAVSSQHQNFVMSV